ncbi:hypothetical protein [Aeromonas phage phiA014S]|uniref:Uncharacterized protein n=1 Tax=Aeromonas phage phiA014S TaxID=3119845 RepID=A0ABZ2CML8_9CAUD
MSKNRNVRNAKAIRKALMAPVPFNEATLKVGQVYRFRNGWLFCKRMDGTLSTDCGCGIDELLVNDYDHDHWYCIRRKIKPVLGVHRFI